MKIFMASYIFYFTGTLSLLFNSSASDSWKSETYCAKSILKDSIYRYYYISDVFQLQRQCWFHLSVCVIKAKGRSPTLAGTATEVILSTLKVFLSAGEPQHFTALAHTQWKFTGVQLRSKLRFECPLHHNILIFISISIYCFKINTTTSKPGTLTFGHLYFHLVPSFRVHLTSLTAEVTSISTNWSRPNKFHHAHFYHKNNQVDNS